MAFTLKTNNLYCTGCRACVQACRDFYNLPAGKTFRLVTESESFREDGSLKVTFQSSCTNPCKYQICIAACPLNLITAGKE